MPHYQYERLDLEWKLVRETSHSQIFRVKLDNGLAVAVNINFTPPPIATAMIVCVGDSTLLTDGRSHTLFDDIGTLARRRDQKYDVIDYSIFYADAESSDGNYAILDR